MSNEAPASFKEACGLHGKEVCYKGKLPSWTIKAASLLPGRGWVEVGGDEQQACEIDNATLSSKLQGHPRIWASL